MSVSSKTQSQSETTKPDSEIAYLHGSPSEGYFTADSANPDNPDYSLRLVTASGKISQEAELVASYSEGQPDKYLPEMGRAEELKTRNQLIEKGIMDRNFEIANEVPEEMKEYAQTMALSETSDFIDREELGLTVYTDETQEANNWVEDYGLELFEYIDQTEGGKQRSRDIAKHIEANPKQIGTALGKLSRKLDERAKYSRSSGINSWNIDLLKEELEIDQILEEGLDVL